MQWEHYRVDDRDSRHARRGEQEARGEEKQVRRKVSCWMPTPDCCSMMMMVLDVRGGGRETDDDDDA